MTTYGLLEVLRQRAGRPSFHVASEKSIRIEFMRFTQGTGMGPLSYGGDVVVTCLQGRFVVGGGETIMEPLTQIVVPEGECLRFCCASAAGAVQILWAPPFAATTPTGLESYPSDKSVLP